ncbi:Serine/threonine-protein kinase/endoribonuclease IRE1 [Orchesella cincta]|uniref:Serine/threonine-protein kinase/endoribonuclease IRE1 n=1 Tax=Orchesella cincta TaxID=48709 RepID=A0A1D2MAP0_ORCCI|nr:Serine/threonine-protein kinase/endoribonuclease IRE1 [Orchesella cincta]
MELALCDLAKRVKELKQWRDAGDPQFAVQEKKLPGFLHGAVKGLMWIHNKRILHRDIKPENVLIFETSNGEIAKLGDFGISRKLSETSTGTNSAGRGTSDWMAPEALQAMNNAETFFSTRNIDIFSLGMTSHYAISLGSHPFKYKSRFGIFIMTNIMQKSVQPTNLSYPHLEADHLFQWMMQKDAQKRPKILVVSHHPFFWNWKQKKDFLLKVAMCFDSKKDSTLLQIRKEVDLNYKVIITKLTSVQSNWLKRLGPRLESLLSQRQHSKGTKKYDGDSIMMLVELFRDKYMHCTDMVDELTTSDLYFGENGSFSEKKYVNYFLNTFPELVIILFCLLADRKKELVVLKNKYYSHFNTVPPIVPVHHYYIHDNHVVISDSPVENLMLI